MLKVGTNILIHPDTTGPGKFGRRLKAALQQYDIDLLPGPAGPVFLASSILQQHEYDYVGKMKILHRVDNTGEMYPWDGTKWTPDTRHVQYVYERADKHIFQTEWSAQQFKKCPTFFSEPKEYEVAFNGVPLRPFETRHLRSGTYASICNTWNMTRMYGYIRNLFPYLRELFVATPFCWMIVGKVDPLIQMLGYHGLSHYIGDRIIPKTYPANLDEVRNNCDGFIHLVCQDSCPNSVVESVMYGLPGIVLRNSGAAELIGDSGFILSDTPSTDEYCDYFELIDGDFDGYRQKAHNQAVKHLDISIVAKIYAEELRKLS